MHFNDSDSRAVQLVVNGLAAESARKQLRETLDDLNDDPYDKQDVQFIYNVINVTKTRGGRSPNTESLGTWKTRSYN